MTNMTPNTQEQVSTWDDAPNRAGILTNSCPTKGGQLTRFGVSFAEFTLAEQSVGGREHEAVGAATADHDQLRWTR